MIVISPLRTARLDVRLRELAIGQEIALCHMPDGAHEKALSEFLHHAIDSAATPTENHVADPRAWTVGERYRALSHYNLHAREDGPNYAVTESTKLSDYLDTARDPKNPVTFEAINDTWTFRPITGAQAEVLESSQMGASFKGREFWLIGLMASQLLRDGEEYPDAATQVVDYSEWLDKRMTVISTLPASDAEALYQGYRQANEQSTQFFRLWFDDQGITVLPKGGAGNLSAARFLVHSGLSELALAITGKSE